MAYTEIHLGGLELDPCVLKWPLYRGADPRVVTITQSGDRAADFAALPYITDLTIDCASIEGLVDPVNERLQISGVRILEVRRMSDERCEIDLSDCRWDLARRVCPADFNMRWKDGYLAFTRAATLMEANQWMRALITELSDVLAPDAFDHVPSGDEYELPDDLPLSGMMLPAALRRLADAVGCDPVVGTDGLLRFVNRGTFFSEFSVNAYAWVSGFEPSWYAQARTPKGLPATIVFHYPERLARRVMTSDPNSTRSMPPELLEEIRNVFSHDDQYLTLEEFLVANGYASDAITLEQLASVINTENFEGTAVEGGLTPQSWYVIATLKRDFRHLWQLYYPLEDGRRGAWVNHQWGAFKQLTDKDGRTEYTGDVTGRPARLEYTEWLAKVEVPGADQDSIELAVVARSRRKEDNNGNLPEAPFSATWVSADDGVFRIAGQPVEGKSSAVWPGRMKDPTQELRVELRDKLIGDAGGTHVLLRDVTHVPTPNDVVFDETFTMEVFIVSERRLPNTAEKWTRIEVAGFADPDVEVLEIEVGPELFALRSGVSGEDEQAGLGSVGRLLNRDALEKDASRRAAVIKDRLGSLIGGDATAAGIALAQDVRYPHGSIAEMEIVTDWPAVLTTVAVGKLDSPEARAERIRIREQSRKVAHGGKVAV